MLLFSTNISQKFQLFAVRKDEHFMSVEKLILNLKPILFYCFAKLVLLCL